MINKDAIMTTKVVFEDGIEAIRKQYGFKNKQMRDIIEDFIFDNADNVYTELDSYIDDGEDFLKAVNELDPCDLVGEVRELAFEMGQKFAVMECETDYLTQNIEDFAAFVKESHGD